MQKTMPKFYHHNHLQYLVAQSLPAIEVIATQHRLFIQPRLFAKEATK